jgi:hypothetical protein
MYLLLLLTSVVFTISGTEFYQKRLKLKLTYRFRYTVNTIVMPIDMCITVSHIDLFLRTIYRICVYQMLSELQMFT